MDENTMKLFAKETVMNFLTMENVVNLQGAQIHHNAKALARVAKANSRLGTLCAIGFGLTYISVKALSEQIRELNDKTNVLTAVVAAGEACENVKDSKEATDEK